MASNLDEMLLDQMIEPTLHPREAEDDYAVGVVPIGDLDADDLLREVDSEEIPLHATVTIPAAEELPVESMEIASSARRGCSYCSDHKLVCDGDGASACSKCKEIAAPCAYPIATASSTSLKRKAEPPVANSNKKPRKEAQSHKPPSRPRETTPLPAKRSRKPKSIDNDSVVPTAPDLQVYVEGDAWQSYVDRVICSVCKRDTDEDALILCDGCDGGAHMYCCNPPLKEVPEGQWFCEVCKSVLNIGGKKKKANKSHSPHKSSEESHDFEQNLDIKRITPKNTGKSTEIIKKVSPVSAKKAAPAPLAKIAKTKQQQSANGSAVSAPSPPTPLMAEPVSQPPSYPGIPYTASTPYGTPATFAQPLPTFQVLPASYAAQVQPSVKAHPFESFHGLSERANRILKKGSNVPRAQILKDCSLSDFYIFCTTNGIDANGSLWSIADRIADFCASSDAAAASFFSDNVNGGM